MVTGSDQLTTDQDGSRIVPSPLQFRVFHPAAMQGRGTPVSPVNNAIV